MEWYYAEGKEQIGPISDSEFRSLVENGTILSDTLVWNSSMDDWKAYGKLLTDETTASQQTPPPDPMSPLEETSPPEDLPPSEGLSSSDEEPNLYCSECGGAFPKDDMVRYEDSLICAACKPVFIQKIKEGIGVTPHLEYAGFWLRFGAKFIDMIILSVIQMIINIPLFAMMGPSMVQMAPDQPPDMSQFWLIYGIVYAIQLAISITYPTWFVGKYAATPGKMICKIKIVMPDGGRVTYLRAFARFFGEMVSWMTFGIGFIMAAFDGQKRALHDHICTTRVVRK